MMAATILDPNHPTFDHVTVEFQGETHVYDYAEFMSLPLARRIELILAGSPVFRLGDEIVDKKRALALG